MISRKLQNQNGSFLVVIPKHFVDMFELSRGDDMFFDIVEKSIRIAPATGPTKTTAAGNTSTTGAPA